MADNLGFDISLSDGEGADLLEQFYNADQNVDDKDKNDQQNQNQDQNNDQDKTNDQNQDDPNKDKDKNKDGSTITLDPKDLEELLKNNNPAPDDAEDKDKDKNKNPDLNKDKNKDQSKDGIFNVLYSDFLERGLFEEIEDFDGTEAGFLKAYNESLFKKAEELKEQEFEEIFTAHPKNLSIGKEFLSYLSKGGDPEQFINIHTEKDYKEDDLDKPVVQEQVMREYLALSGLSSDKIDAKIERLKALESLEEEAKDAFDVVKKRKEDNKKSLLESAETNQKANTKRIEEFNESIRKTINDNTELYGFQLGKDTKMKRETLDYMFKPTEKTEDGRLLPKFAIDRQKVAQDPKWIAFQALALKNDLDFSKVFETAKTQVASTLQKKLEGVNEIRKNSSDGSGTNDIANEGKKMGNLEELLANTLRN